jgi:Protein of unknown function (DUF3455)
MSYNFGQQTKNSARVRAPYVAALVLACAFGTVTLATAQTVTPPPTPTAITPPAGNSAFLVGHAFGSQGYTCLPTSTGATSWTVNPAARPEATLFATFFGQPVQIITHFASVNANPNGKLLPVSLGGNATWQSSFDTSKVWAAVLGPHSIVAGTDAASCPNTGSIPCLLLESIGNQKGPTGGNLLAQTTFVQRLNTNGGSAPTTACSVGQTQLQPYTADYFFYRQAQ